jgi:hypothetical protein
VKEQQSLFRPDAVRRYAEAHEDTVQLRSIRPRLIALLWLLLIVLALATTATWLVRVPVEASVPAVVVALPEVARSAHPPHAVIAFVSPAQLAKVQVRQPLHLTFSVATATFHLDATISAVEPRAWSAATLRRRFALAGSVVRAFAGPVGLVIATLPPGPDGASARIATGQLISADLAIGSRSLLGLISGGPGMEAP